METASTDIRRQRSDSTTLAPLSQIRQVALDCREICEITASLLSRRGPLAPAICQSCADACDRLNTMMADLRPALDVVDLQTQLDQCATACRAVISAA